MSHEAIIEKWPSISAFAGDVGVRYGTAKAMRQRASIPSKYWSKVVAAAKRRRIAGVTLEALACGKSKEAA